MEHKQHESNWNPIYHTLSGYWIHTAKRITAMAEIKFGAALLNLLGYSLTGFLLFANLDVFQQTVVWLIVVAFWLAKLYFYIVFSNQKRQRNNLEMERMRKELAAKE